MLDLHSHILPGLDDGVGSIEEAVALAQSALADGIGTIAATPHVRADYPTTPERMERGVEELRAALAGAGVQIELLCGGEVDIEQMSRLSDGDLRRFTIAQTGRYLLVEFPYSGWPLGLEAVAGSLRNLGIVPIFAHPERSRVVQADPRRVATLVEEGGLVQMTAASLDGRLGRSTRAAARELLDLGLVDLLASDAHSPDLRAVGLSAAAAEVGDPGLARHLTVDVPAAVAAGEPLPGRPAPVRRRRRLRRRPKSE